MFIKMQQLKKFRDHLCTDTAPNSKMKNGSVNKQP
jgi:hypothetical protein